MRGIRRIDRGRDRKLSAKLNGIGRIPRLPGHSEAQALASTANRLRAHAAGSLTDTTR